MPLFIFRCNACKKVEERFIRPGDMPKQCPKCSSDDYVRQVSRTLLNIEYADKAEYMEKKIQPLIDETYQKIGKEAMFEETSTLEDIYGRDKVERTFYRKDDWGDPEEA